MSESNKEEKTLGSKSLKQRSEDKKVRDQVILGALVDDIITKGRQGVLTPKPLFVTKPTKSTELEPYGQIENKKEYNEYKENLIKKMSENGVNTIDDLIDKADDLGLVLREPVKRYETREEEYQDVTKLTTDEVNAFFEAFDDNILTPQYDKNGRMFFNSEGCITLGELLNILADKNVDITGTSSDGVSDVNDYFNNGYNQLLEKLGDKDKLGLTRNDLFIFVNYSLLKTIFSIMKPESTLEDLSNLIKLPNLDNTFNISRDVLDTPITRKHLALLNKGGL